MRWIALRSAVLAGVLAATSSHAAFHLAVIDELMSGVNGDPAVQYVEIRMTSPAQLSVAGTRLTAFNCTGSSHSVLLQVGSNITQGANTRWIMATTSFAAAAGITPDFTWNPATAGNIDPTCGMVCWGAPGVLPQNPPTWDAANPDNYVDCLAYGGYLGATKTSIHDGTPVTGLPSGLPPGDGTASLTRMTVSTPPSDLADFALAAPTPTNNTGQTGAFHAGSTTTSSTTTTTALATTSTTGGGATSTTSTSSSTATASTAPASSTTTSTVRLATTTSIARPTTTTIVAGPACAPAALLACDDGDACSVDRCLDGTGCVHDRVTAPADLERVGPACTGQPVPAAVAQQFVRGCGLIDAAKGQPSKKAKAVLARAVRALKRAAKTAQRVGAKKKSPLSPDCAAALQSALGGARDQALREKSAL